MKGIIAYRHIYPAVIALMQQGYFRAEDMGQLAVYLATAVHVTGQAIAVDGGFSL